MGSAAIQGRLWGARAQDWATYVEQVSLPLAVNTIFYAHDMAAAMRELVRVVRPGGRVVVTAARRSPSAPGSLVRARSVAAVLREAGLRVVDEGEVACPFVFPTADASWRGSASAGVNQAAIAHSGEAAVRAVYAHADRTHARPDGSVRYENVFLRGAGERP